MIFGHGDDFYHLNNEIKINFSSNVWHQADLSGLKTFLHENFEAITHYPDPDAGALRRAIAHFYAIDEHAITVTNGSITAFYLLAQAFSGKRSTILTPTFAEYEDACRLHHHQLTFISNPIPLSQINLKGEDLCWICNPNNPDGKVFKREILLAFIAAHPHTYFLIDQTYLAFTTEELISPSDLTQYPNLILAQSISKAYNIPGIRIGYLLGHPTLIKKLNEYLIPWSVNALAIKTGEYILTHHHQFKLPLLEWLKQTNDFIQQVNGIKHLEVIPTETTYFLIHLDKGNATELKKHLIEKEGILVRDASNFRGLNDPYIRVSTQTPCENKALIKALLTRYATE